MRASKKFKVSLRDLLHGFITAGITASAIGLIDSMSIGQLPDLEHIKKHAIIGLYGGCAYLIKKFITNSEGGVLKPEPKDTLK